MIRFSKALLIAAGWVATTGVALAQDTPPDGEAAPMPAEPEAEPEPEPEPAGEPLTLYKGKILIAGSTVNINLSTDAAFEPISLAPSVWYGVNDKLTVGLVHDGGTTPWSPRPPIFVIPVPNPLPGQPDTASIGGGICLTGESGGCADPYGYVGVDALYAIKNERFSLAAHPGLDIGTFDPFQLALRLGALGRYLVTNELAIVFDPRLRFGVTERDTGNTELLDVPIWIWYEINDKISAYVHSGINGYFDGFGDNFSVPLQLGANYKVNAQLTAGLDFGFTRLNDGADGRVLGLRVAYAL